MVTVHRLPVIDDKEEATSLLSRRDSFIDTAEEYARNLLSLTESVNREMEQGETQNIKARIREVERSFDEVDRKRLEFNRFLEDSSLSFHSSYPSLDEEARELFEQDYGREPEKMLENDPEDFYFIAAWDYTVEGYIEWIVESESIDSLEEIEAAVGKIPEKPVKTPMVENKQLPDTDPGKLCLDPAAFENLVMASSKTSDSKLYDLLAPIDEYIKRRYGKSLVENLLGPEKQEKLLNKNSEITGD